MTDLPPFRAPRQVQMELRELNRVETEDMQRQIKELREDKQRVQRTLQTNDVRPASETRAILTSMQDGETV